MWVTNMDLGNHQHVDNNQNHRKGESPHGVEIRWDKMRPGEGPLGSPRDALGPVHTGLEEPTLLSCVSGGVTLTA